MKETSGGKKALLFMVGTVVIVIVSLIFVISMKLEEKGKELACREEAIAAEKRGEAEFGEYLKNCYEPSIFNPNAYRGIEEGGYR